METISFSEVNKEFEFILDKMNDDEVICINRHEANNTVIMSLAHYNSLMETLYLLGSSANAAHLAKSIGQCRDGKVSIKALV